MGAIMDMLDSITSKHLKYNLKDGKLASEGYCSRMRAGIQVLTSGIEPQHLSAGSHAPYSHYPTLCIPRYTSCALFNSLLDPVVIYTALAVLLVWEEAVAGEKIWIHSNQNKHSQISTTCLKNVVHQPRPADVEFVPDALTGRFFKIQDSRTVMVTHAYRMCSEVKVAMPSGMCNRTNTNKQRIKYPHYLQYRMSRFLLFCWEYNSKCFGI